MAEGHAVHALAGRFHRAFVGQVARASSPQGEFPDASLLDGRTAGSAEAYGKNLVVSYGDAWLHVHLGMFGRFQVRQHRRVRPAAPPLDLPLSGAIRLRLVTLTHVGDLRAPTICRLLDEAGFESLLSRIGPDPIRSDADPELVWAGLRASQRPLAELLMEQSLVSGIGNVYRAELLHRNEIDPFVPGAELSREAFDRLWLDTVDLMTLGAAANRIYTTRGDLDWARGLLVRGEVPPRRRPMYAVYSRTGRACPRCGHEVQSTKLAGRVLYWCPGCQRRR